GAEIWAILRPRPSLPCSSVRPASARRRSSRRGGRSSPSPSSRRTRARPTAAWTSGPRSRRASSWPACRTWASMWWSRASATAPGDLQATRRRGWPGSAGPAANRWSWAEPGSTCGRWRRAERVDAMLAAGLVDEVRRTLGRPVAPDSSGLDGVGYREVVAMLAGRLPERGLRDAIVVATRRYAKRQETWFRHQLRDGGRG